MPEDAGPDIVKYKDSNGVLWVIVRPPSGRLFAHMDQSSPIVYDPEPTDVGPVSRFRIVGENEAEERNVLEHDIEDAVKGLKPALKVAAHTERSGAGWLLLVLLLLAAADD